MKFTTPLRRRAHDWNVATLRVAVLVVVGKADMNGARLTTTAGVGLAFFPASIAVGLLIAFRHEHLGASFGLPASMPSIFGRCRLPVNPRAAGGSFGRLHSVWRRVGNRLWPTCPFAQSADSVTGISAARGIRVFHGRAALFFVAVSLAIALAWWPSPPASE